MLLTLIKLDTLRIYNIGFKERLGISSVSLYCFKDIYTVAQ